MLTTSVKVLLAGLILNAQAGVTEVMIYSGKAYAPDNPRQLLYCEKHLLQLRGDKPYRRNVSYFNADGKLIAQKENQYFSNPAAPDFRLQDLRHHYHEQARYNDDGSLLLSLQENSAAEEQKTLLTELPENLVIDAGFDEFVRLHWQSLLSGKEVSFSFASAARQDIVNFRLEKTSLDDRQLVLSMRLKSRLLAWLLDPIELTYERDSQRLLRYRGLSNIMDSTGNTYHADIRYEYPGDCPN